MNIKSVLRVYGHLRQLTDDETALLETLRKFTDAEREAFVEALQPQKQVVKRRGRKPLNVRASASKSPRATALESQLKARAGTRGQVNNKARCVAITNDVIGERCGEVEDDPIHDTQWPTSHSFTLGANATAVAHQQAKSNGSPACTFIVNPESQEPCGAMVDDPIHDLSYSSAHGFVVGGEFPVSGDY